MSLVRRRDWRWRPGPCSVLGGGVCLAPPLWLRALCSCCFFYSCQGVVSCFDLVALRAVGCVFQRDETVGSLQRDTGVGHAEEIRTQSRSGNSGLRCNSANNGRKPQKAHSKTETQPTSADQRCKNRSTQTRPRAASRDKKHRMRTEAAGTEQHTQHQTALSATKPKA